MTYPNAETPAARTASWRDSALARVTGAGASWFLFVLSFTLLVRASVLVMSIGGSCASGGPYEIAVECPDTVTAVVPLSIYGGLFAVGIALVLARGFGTPLTTWAWPILFIGLGGAFLLAFVFAGDVTGLIIGGMFVIMGLAPLVIELRGSPQRVFLGQRAANGVQFYEGEKARRSLMSPMAPNPPGAIPPTAAHWGAALLMPALFGGLGYIVAGLIVR